MKTVIVDESLVRGLKDVKNQIETILKDYEEKHEPEFKVPGWYVSEPNEIFYAVSKEKLYDADYVWLHTMNKTGTRYGSRFCRPATPAEIESHLRKICDEKYVGKKVKCLFEGEFIVESFWKYDSYDDKIWYREKDNIQPVCVYDQGKFAEIISDKKKLPKTREEFKIILCDCFDFLSENKYHTVEQFLYEYED